MSTDSEEKSLAPRSAQWREELRKALSAKERGEIPRVVMPMLDPEYRITCNEEVNRGISAEAAVQEATRCLDCPNPQCIQGCPVNIDIPGFVKNIQRGHFIEAADVLAQTSALPAVCGRVCPQEKQCESRCIYNKMHKAPVAIGYLERFAADFARMSRVNPDEVNKECPESNGIKIAVVGSGPAGLSFAGEMARRGYKVTVYEALHQIGGVLKYGIPEFRLPNEIVDAEIQNLVRLGVDFENDIVVGKTLSLEDLREAGFKGIFVASGAGLPRFMGIEGENLIGVMSSNEYLTRVNLMHAGRGGETPVEKGKRVAIIGGGNTAMDSVRTARRMRAQEAIIVYRRSEDEMPARVEEIQHAKEEGVIFMTLHNPISYRGDERGHVTHMLLQCMALGEPDASGRRSPQPIEGKTVEIPIDEVIVSVGVSPNPLIPNSFHGLEVSRRGTITVNDSLESSIDMLFAGGDIVRGGATVILAMGDGRKAAIEMDRKFKEGATEG